MNKPKFDNEIIVIGGDHYNTLAAVRCFGANNYSYKVGLLTENSNMVSRIGQSRYGKGRTKVLGGENEAVQWLLNEGNNLRIKGFIVPCSDLAAYIIDAHANELNSFFYVPGFVNKPGKVVSMMDKYEQKKFADKHGIKMAKTWEIRVDNPQLSDIIFPCIIKPQVSAFGSKADISIAHDYDELLLALETLRKHKYDTVLCQLFLQKEYEACAYGHIPYGRISHEGVVVRKIRENHGGSTAFAQILNSARLEDEVDRLCEILCDEGYNGLYDFEFFVCEDGIYLNEINFRQSGNGYALVNLGIPSPLNWACSCLNIPTSNMKNCAGKYHMDDIGELIAVKHGEISFITYIRHILKSMNCSVLNFHDISGTISYYKSLM